VALKEQLRYSGDSGFRPSAQMLSELKEDIDALESICQCGLMQERIAGDVLSFARIQLNMLLLHEIEMDPRREARKLISIFASEARMKTIDIKLQIPSVSARSSPASYQTRSASRPRRPYAKSLSHTMLATTRPLRGRTSTPLLRTPRPLCLGPSCLSTSPCTCLSACVILARASQSWSKICSSSVSTVSLVELMGTS
jgi:hypothetical protein